MAINDLNRPSRYYVGQDGSIHIYNRCMFGFLSDFIRFHMIPPCLMLLSMMTDRHTFLGRVI